MVVADAIGASNEKFSIEVPAIAPTVTYTGNWIPREAFGRHAKAVCDIQARVLQGTISI
jgi:hypothetical protein